MAEAVTAAAPRLGRSRVLRQHWRNVSFVHWAVDPSRIAHLYPPETEPDIWDGRSYVGLVLFEMVDTGLAHGPVLIDTFLETNVRLYSVDTTGRRGVVFLSLDTNRLDVVVAARTVFGFPYRWARMGYGQHAGRHTYTAKLRRPWAGPASSAQVLVGDGLSPGPLEHFLTARWGLHVARAGRTWYLPNEHPAWTLQAAELVGFTDDGLFASVGLGGLGTRPPDHVAFSSGLATRFGSPVLATTPRPALR